MRFLICALLSAVLKFLCLILPVYAEEYEESEAVEFSTSLQSWVYSNSFSLAKESVLNPGNRIVYLPEMQGILDIRPDLRIRLKNHEWVLRPRLIGERNRINTQEHGQRNDDNTHSERLRWNEAFYRLTWRNNTLTTGRELYTWGPAIFRSPGNPFYFDSGRTNPLADVPGIDLARLTHIQKNLKLTGAYVWNTKTLPTTPEQNDALLFKLDQQGHSYTASIITSQRTNKPPFIGGVVQLTSQDAWLIYMEWSSSRRPSALIPLNTANGLLYAVEQPSKRAATVLSGVNYTFFNGQILTGEYLYNGHGYTRQNEQQYFLQARRANLLFQTEPGNGQTALVAAVGQTSALLSRNYLYLNWQSNPQDDLLYWRYEWIINMQDKSHRHLFYVEKNFTSRLSGFVGLSLNRGETDTEFGSLVRSIKTLGIKLFIL